jgi:hypothetical protein
MAIKTFGNGERDKEGHIFVKALSIVGCGLKLSEASFLEAPYLLVETERPLVNEGDIKSHVCEIKRDFTNKGDIDTEDLRVKGFFLNEGKALSRQVFRRVYHPCKREVLRSETYSLL